ncbi:uncharacterized protein LOC130048345 isoform X1 [Ostrea edulis]|uniref:uncharacterized protein LOC130048345 isoform X1 n=2 Tax=Ostrea edulis TaxID=37623 RepID=UPI0024AF9956|nr:uncharacterized protein LOC130048345 isoform X1 [Ostrea edulis]
MHWIHGLVLFSLLKVSSGDMFNITPRLVDKQSDGNPMESTTASTISKCANLCQRSTSCSVFRYNNNSHECGLYSGQNYRDVGADVGSSHFQKMPSASSCTPGIDEWFPDSGLCIYIHTDPIPYSAAQTVCHAMSRELVSLQTTAKYLAFKALMSRLDFNSIHLYSERINSKSYQWQDGSPVNNHWCPHQPDKIDDCLGMLVADHWCMGWGIDDSTCMIQRRFFCE